MIKILVPGTLKRIKCVNAEHCCSTMKKKMLKKKI